MTQHRSPAKPPGTNGLYQPFSYKTRLTDLLRIKIIPGEPMARHADDLDEESFSLPSNRMQKAVLDEHMRRKGRAVMRIMGLFALCAGVGVAVWLCWAHLAAWGKWVWCPAFQVRSVAVGGVGM